MKLHVESFGRVGAGSAFLYTLTNASGAYVRITDYSGAVVALGAPDKKGRVDGVVAGFRDVKQYVKNDGYLGALIGPVGNRIAGAAFDFGGAHYAFTPNEGSSTLLHSGDFGFHAGLWDVSCEVAETEGRLVLTRDFPEEKTGFPGNLKATVTYTFTDANALSIHYHIESDKPSFASPTNHTYFNLAGFGMKSLPEVGRQKIEIFADRYTTIDEKSIPTGTADVTGTPFDLRAPVKIADGLALEAENEQLKNGQGYDHNFILSGEKDENGLRLAARVTDERTGRVMKVFTDMPGVQFYSGNFLKRYNAAEHRYYKKRMALCLETQCAPDSVHHVGENGFDVMTIEPGRPLDSTTVYQFETL